MDIEIKDLVMWTDKKMANPLLPYEYKRCCRDLIMFLEEKVNEEFKKLERWISENRREI